MPYRKLTLRRLSPVTRKLARLIGELESTTTRAKHLLEEVHRLEHDSQALAKTMRVKPAAADPAADPPIEPDNDLFKSRENK